MLISFVGSPCSGKTTVSALMFAQLKDTGYPVEFIPEQARYYIAAKRVETGAEAEKPLVLTDEDQLAIMRQQHSIEAVMTTACGPSVAILTDSSPVNALLYMSEAQRANPQVQHILSEYIRRQPLIFYVHPVSSFGVFDPNRVHSPAVAAKLNTKIPALLEQLQLPYIVLQGDSEKRAEQALSALYSWSLGDQP